MPAYECPFGQCVLFSLSFRWAIRRLTDQGTPANGLGRPLNGLGFPRNGLGRPRHGPIFPSQYRGLFTDFSRLVVIESRRPRILLLCSMFCFLECLLPELAALSLARHKGVKILRRNFSLVLLEGTHPGIPSPPSVILVSLHPLLL